MLFGRSPSQCLVFMISLSVLLYLSLSPGRKWDKNCSHLWLSYLDTYFSLNLDLWASTLTASYCSKKKKKKKDVSEIYTNLWIEKYQCRRQFDSMIIQQNKSNRSIQGLWAICHIWRIRNAFPLIEQTLNPIRKHLCHYCTQETILPSWSLRSSQHSQLCKTFLLQQFKWHLPVLWKLVSM